MIGDLKTDSIEVFEEKMKKLPQGLVRPKTDREYSIKEYVDDYMDHLTEVLKEKIEQYNNMKEIKAYIAKDGTLFSDKGDCIERDKLITCQKEIMEFGIKYSVPLMPSDNYQTISVGPDLICLLEHAEELLEIINRTR